MQPIGHMLAGNPQGRTVFHQAHIVDVGNFGTTNALVDPAHHIAQNALRIVIQFRLNIFRAPIGTLRNRH